MKKSMIFLGLFLSCCHLFSTPDILVFRNGFISNGIEWYKQRIIDEVKSNKKNDCEVLVCGKPSGRDFYEAVKIKMASPPSKPVYVISVIETNDQPISKYRNEESKSFLKKLSQVGVNLLYVRALDFEFSDYRFDLKKILEKEFPPSAPEADIIEKEHTEGIFSD